MLPFRSFLVRSLRAAPLAAALSLGVLAGGPPPALAQASNVCQEIGPFMSERKSLVEAVQKLGGKDKKMDPKAACAAFGKLATNGTTMLKWASVNKDWCQIPEQFVQNIQSDHDKVLKIRGQACGAAAKQAELEKRARSGQGGGLLGGGGLEGSYKIPQGAL